ncbi:MAG: cell division protein ZapA [Duncaniella sp.]|nr:cell division protein ZapA [Duncaniella sp.]
MKDKLRIKIRIANLPDIPVSVSPEEEEYAREAQKNINLLWDRWSERFSENKPGEILGMIAFRFAQMYFTALGGMKDMAASVDDLEKALDNALLEAGSES